MIGEITTKSLVVVLNKIDMIAPDQREKKITKTKAALAKVFAQTKFKDPKVRWFDRMRSNAASVCVPCCAPGSARAQMHIRLVGRGFSFHGWGLSFEALLVSRLLRAAAAVFFPACADGGHIGQARRSRVRRQGNRDR